MLKKKPLLSQIKDVEIVDRTKKNLKTVPYKHSESIQEEEEQQSSLSQFNVQGHKKFVMTCPQQPIDFQGSEEIRAPTVITNVITNKSVEQLAFKPDSKRQQLNFQELSSKLSSSFNSMRSINPIAPTIDPTRVKVIVDQIKLKFLNLIHYSKYNDPLLTQEYQELSPLKYYYFNLYIFLSTTISIILSTVFIPISQIFEVTLHVEIVGQISFGFALLTILQDLLFQRGPYKMVQGNIKSNYKEENKRLLDSIRMILILFINFFDTNSVLKLVAVLGFLIAQLRRQSENFENIYKSTHYFIFIIQLWITIICSFACIYLVSNQDSEPTISFCITFAISLVTHSTNISILLLYLVIEVSDQNSVLISIYMILSYLCIAYTTMVLFIWLKPDIEIEEEKQKLLKAFVERFRMKCQNDGLLRRCYSYLEFRIDEDLNKAKDQLTKKLSPGLEDEIDLSVRSTMIDKIELMNRFSPHFKQQLLYEIEQVTFNPEDNIIIEHQVEDLGLFYILKGSVKVQFQGSSLGNNKRAVTTLTEGQTFGQYSFITGIPSNISIFSSGVTTLMKLKRSDFIQIISNYPKDNEVFCTIKDNAFYNSNLFECYYCKIKGLYVIECRHLQYFPQRINVIEKYLYTEKQPRRKFKRKELKYFAWQDMSLNQDRAHSYVNKQSQDQVSDEFREASQLPYSESKNDQTHQSVSFVSNSLGQKNYSPDMFQQQSNANLDSLEQFNMEQEYQEEQTIPFQEPQIKNIRKNSNKTTLKTAGFPASFENNLNNISNNLSMIEKDDREILQQLQEAQMNKERTILYSAQRNNVANKLTFQFQKDTSSQLLLKEDQVKTDSYQGTQQQGGQPSHLKQSIRQPSSRSYTYSNSLSKDISNNASSHSRQNKLSILSSQNKVIDPISTKKVNSERSLTDQNRMTQTYNKSLKSGTKQSTPNQQSQFQALTTPENQGYFINDILFNNFEKMQDFKTYFPHNNYDKVIGRYIKFLETLKENHNKRKKHGHANPYSIKCFVASRIKRVKRLLTHHQTIYQ